MIHNVFVVAVVVVCVVQTNIDTTSRGFINNLKTDRSVEQTEMADPTFLNN